MLESKELIPSKKGAEENESHGGATGTVGGEVQSFEAD